MAITHDSILAVINVLAAERAKVAASSASDLDKKHAELLIDQLTNSLEIALEDQPNTWNGWMLGLGPQFKELALELNTILGLDVGACDYNGDCIQTTADVCANLPNSTFFPGVPCSLSPPNRRARLARNAGGQTRGGSPGDQPSGS
jgi:hypothetical protein